MFFKWSASALMTGLVLMAVGCANEGEPKDQTIVVQPKTGSSNCLTEFGAQFDAYKDGKMGARQLNEFWNCMAGAVNEFSQLTTGDVGGNYSPEAIWKFLNKYFLKNKSVDADLLRSIMEFKKVLVGGAVNRVTKSELITLTQFINELRQVSLDINPHVKVVLQSASAANASELAEANMAVERSALRLGKWFTAQGQSYDFRKLQDLLDSLAEANGGSENWKTLQESVEVLAKAKSITVGFPIETIANSQWESFFNTVGSAYGLFLNWQYGHRPGIINSLALPVSRDSVDRLTDILEQGVLARSRAQSSLGLSEFDDLFNLLEQKKWLGESVSAAALSKTMRWFVARLLTRASSQNVLVSENLEEAHLATLRKYLNDWDDVSLFASRWPGGNPTQPRVKTFVETLKTSWDLVLDSSGRLQFGSNLSYEPSSLQVLAWQFMAVAWLKDSYLPEGQTEMGRNDMMVAVSEVLPLIQSYGYLLETELDVYKKLIVWADLFMPSSDGNRQVSSFEATHFLAFLVSSLKSGEIWLQEADKICTPNTNQANCGRDLLWNSSESLFSAMPGMAKLAQSKNYEEWQEFSHRVELTALGRSQEAKWELSDNILYFMLLHYLETFVQRFDTNKNGTISYPESMGALPVFQLNLQGLGVPESDVKPFFTFLLKYGEKHFDRYGGLVEFQYWKRHDELWVYESNRDILIKILYELNRP